VSSFPALAEILFCPIGGRGGREFFLGRIGEARAATCRRASRGNGTARGAGGNGYFFARLFRPSASFAASPFSWAIFFFASEYFRATKGVFVGMPNCLR